MRYIFSYSLTRDETPHSVGKIEADSLTSLNEQLGFLSFKDNPLENCGDFVYPKGQPESRAAYCARCKMHRREHEK